MPIWLDLRGKRVNVRCVALCADRVRIMADVGTGRLSDSVRRQALRLAPLRGE
jgi:hypothetical protein